MRNRPQLKLKNVSRSGRRNPWLRRKDGRQCSLWTGIIGRSRFDAVAGILREDRNVAQTTPYHHTLSTSSSGTGRPLSRSGGLLSDARRCNDGCFYKLARVTNFRDVSVPAKHNSNRSRLPQSLPLHIAEYSKKPTRSKILAVRMSTCQKWNFSDLITHALTWCMNVL